MLDDVVLDTRGHFVGIDHTLDGSATMNAGYQQGTTELRTIEQDDIGALCAAYPPGRSAKCIPSPKGGLGSECGGEPAEDGGCSLGRGAPAPAPGGGLWLVALGLAAVRLGRGLAPGDLRRALAPGARRRQKETAR